MRCRRKYAGDRAGYIRDVVIAGMEAGHAEDLIDAVDGFCEGIAFRATRWRRSLIMPGGWACR